MNFQIYEKDKIKLNWGNFGGNYYYLLIKLHINNKLYLYLNDRGATN